MSARYRAYPQRPAGVTEFERVTANNAGGGKALTAYKIYAGEVFCRIKILDASDGSVVLCGTKFSGRNILLNHIRLQHRPEHDAIIRIFEKGKGGPNNANAKNEAEVHFTEQMILIDAATQRAHLSGLQQVNNTVTAPQTAAPKAAIPSKRGRALRKRSAFEEDYYEDLLDQARTVLVQDEEEEYEEEENEEEENGEESEEESEIDRPPKKPKKTAKAAAPAKENEYGFDGDTYKGIKNAVPEYRNRPNKTKMFELLGLNLKARCPNCTANNTRCPPPKYLGKGWKKTNWEQSTCQLLANFVQPEDEE